uniref:Insulin-like domain-containing protein n=1 Tax=Nothobranchius furzeri TaxID=105023 RepID=A0A8C6K5W8_NOTFU
MHSSSRALLLALLTIYIVNSASAGTLCGADLVEALQFVCEDRGFYFSRFPEPYKFSLSSLCLNFYFPHV